MNAIDQDLASAYERHGGAVKAWKHLGKKTAGSVKDAVKKGGKAVGDYFTEKMKTKWPIPERKSSRTNTSTAQYNWKSKQSKSEAEATRKQVNKAYADKQSNPKFGITPARKK